MSFFIGNPSRWGPVAKNFVKTAPHDVAGLCETHKDKEDVKTLEAQRLPGRFAGRRLSSWARRAPKGVRAGRTTAASLWLRRPQRGRRLAALRGAPAAGM